MNPSGTLATLAVFDDGGGPGLYVTGDFDYAGEGPAAGIAMWNGSLWWPLGSGLGQTGDGRELKVFEDQSGGGPALFVAGDFSWAGGIPTPRVARWDGASWSGLAPDRSSQAPCRSSATGRWRST